MSLLYGRRLLPIFFCFLELALGAAGGMGGIFSKIFLCYTSGCRHLVTYMCMLICLYRLFYYKTATLEKWYTVIPQLFKVSSCHAAIIMRIALNCLFERIKQIYIFFIISNNDRIMLPVSTLAHKNNDGVALCYTHFELG